MATVVKAKDLRAKPKAELEKQLNELKVELASLRVNQVTGSQPAKLAKIKGVRRSIARVYTVITANQRNSAREKFKKKPMHQRPLDLRPKLTRKIRKQLPLSKRKLLTLRQKKKLANYPIRKYAVKA
eukprot:TRINITY_DN499_c0_g1_i1.p1 TRINITY_DN499_c0_g1~~TRINITY_DN499_c0_g1_i1.p1  ORF type:complete len:141 (-),score=28.79 TRINITY_DN499_c0_g1_i1:42-422(-)